MPRSLIIGSGPAAAAAAMALTEDPAQEVRVVDVGAKLEDSSAAAVQHLAATAPESWDPREVARIARLPVASAVAGLPEKRVYGSDYPFRDVGQLAGLRSAGSTNRSVISGAFGGFSNVWGSQVMPYSPAGFEAWPFRRTAMEPHYRAVLARIPFSGHVDDLAGTFPLFGNPDPLPALAERTRWTLERAMRHRADLTRLGVTVGRARLALSARPCRRCSLCMTGCPYDLIYSAAHTFRGLIGHARIHYLPGLLATRIGEDDGQAWVEATELGSGRQQRFTADRVFVACGAIGSTRLVLNSQRQYGAPARLQESVQFAVPTFSLRRTPDPRTTKEMTLNQFNVVVTDEEHLSDVAQLHFYPFNDAILEALPAAFRTRAGAPPTTALLRRMSVALGYLPSSACPTLSVTATAPRTATQAAPIDVAGTPFEPLHSPAFRSVAARLARAGRYLDLYPALPLVRFSAPGKSYHWGGSFPHRAGRTPDRNTTDVLGRPNGWRRIHLVDAAVFPSVAATTFTLTIMANAHRIAAEAKTL